MPRARRFWAFWLITLVTCLGVLSTAALGRWQLSRAAQKEALSAEIHARGNEVPLPDAVLRALLAPDAAPATVAAELYRQASVRGQWLADKTVFLDNRQMDGKQGFLVLTPLQLEGIGQPVVLVQRGWAPRNYAQRTQLPPVETDAGVVEVEGHLAGSPGQNFALGSDQQDSGFNRIRQNLTLDAFRTETALPLATFTLVQEGADSEGLVRHWAEVSTGVETNYGYAFQWFALCALILGLYVWFQFVRLRKRS